MKVIARKIYAFVRTFTKDQDPIKIADWSYSNKQQRKQFNEKSHFKISWSTKSNACYSPFLAVEAVHAKPRNLVSFHDGTSIVTFNVRTF